MAKSRQRQRKNRRSRKPISPLHRRSISKGLIRFWDKKGRKKKEDKSERRKKIQLAVAAVTTTAAGVGLIYAVSKIKKDLKASQVDFNSIRTPPNGGIPDAITLAKYDSFPPGSIVRKHFRGGQMGTRSHYAVYLGKDAKTGLHTTVDVNRDPVTNINMIRKSTLEYKAGPNETEYELVKDFITKDNKPIYTPEQVIRRANEVLGAPFEHTGFESNCEAFARAIVEGSAKSTQADKVSKLTSTISKIAVLGQIKVEKLVNASRLDRVFHQRHKMTSIQIKGFLDDVEWADKITNSTNVLTSKELKKIAQIRERQKLIRMRKAYVKNEYDIRDLDFSKSTEKVENLNYKALSQLCFKLNSERKTPTDFYSLFGIETPEILYEKIEELKTQFLGSKLIQDTLEKEIVTQYFYICLIAMRSLIKNEQEQKQN
jgi:hypothetical protein